MHELTLEWLENSPSITVRRSETIGDRRPSRIGRDPVSCDIAIDDATNTVSRLHVEIFFHQQQQCFYLRNLRQVNPPLVNRQLIEGEVPLTEGSSFYLGQVFFVVTRVARTASRLEKLLCVRCDRPSPYEMVNSPCPWCGSFLGQGSILLS